MVFATIASKYSHSYVIKNISIAVRQKEKENNEKQSRPSCVCVLLK